MALQMTCMERRAGVVRQKISCEGKLHRRVYAICVGGGRRGVAGGGEKELIKVLAVSFPRASGTRDEVMIKTKNELMKKMYTSISILEPWNCRIITHA